MRKPDEIKGLRFFFILLLIALLIFSCQPPKDPLSAAEFPCECLFKSTTTYAVKFKCQNGEYYFVDEKYNRGCKKNEVITEPLNK